MGQQLAHGVEATSEVGHGLPAQVDGSGDAAHVAQNPNVPGTVKSRRWRIGQTPRP